MQMPSRAQQGVWIIVLTVKTQPLLKITSGISERATLSEEEKGGEEEGKGWRTTSHQRHRPLTHTDAHDRARFHVFAKLPTLIFFQSLVLSLAILRRFLFSTKFYFENSTLD